MASGASGVGGRPGPLGGFLVVAGVALLGFFEFGGAVAALPVMVPVVSFPVLSLALVALGVVLRSHQPPTEGWEPYRDDVPSAPPAGGWINGYVREGFDVDGSESRTSPLGMDTRLAINRFLYDGTGPVLLTLGSTVYRVWYPLLRVGGRLLGREAAAEQYIAEREYVIHHLQNYERRGLVNPRGVASLILQIAFVLPFLFLGLVAGEYRF